MKILGVIDEDPFATFTWSGSSNFFFSALKEDGYLCDAISATPSKQIQLYYKMMNIQSDMDKWKFKYHLDTRLFEQMTKVAKQKISHYQSNSYDAVLQIGAWYDLTEIKDKVLASYHDGNLATRLKSPYGYPGINKSHIKRAFNYEKKLYAKMNFIFPMSKWLASAFINDFDVNADKVFPVGAGINLPYVKTVEERDEDNPVILFVGKDFDRKGGRVLLDAFSRVRKYYKKAELVIVGTMLENMPEGVRCEGFISKHTSEGVEKLLNLYARASIFVLPSLYEPFGISFAEAMAHRLPCIGTNNCAMPEIIDNGITGRIVETGESEALSTAIIELLADPALRKEMGDRGYEKYYENYRWEVVVDKMISYMSHQG